MKYGWVRRAALGDAIAPRAGAAWTKSGISTVGALHEHLVLSRRAKVLAGALHEVLPEEAKTVLDVGCGDGKIARLLLCQRPGLSLTGVDVLVRSRTYIPVRHFDGVNIPFDDRSFDAVLFTDVLHHTIDPMILLKEAKRVTRMAVVLKDHTLNGLFAYTTLRFMDWVGNVHHNVALPYNYWRRSQWIKAFQDLHLDIDCWKDGLGLYPIPASWMFERKLHFIARLTPVGR